MKTIDRIAEALGIDQLLPGEIESLEQILEAHTHEAQEQSFNPFRDIVSFHEKFKLPPKTTVPAFGDSLFMSYRFKFLEEELLETIKAYETDDLAGFLDGLVDLCYVAIGTAQQLNLPFLAAWGAVHKANMAKERAETAEQSPRGVVGDMFKPQGWTPPDIQAIIDQHTKALTPHEKASA